MAKTSNFEAKHANDSHDPTRSALRPTDLQGQYLAYIVLYTKLHRTPPAEADMQAYFCVTPPSVHRMVVELEKRGFVRRQPGKARSLEVLLPADQIPPLR
jgi:DNA-binding MarR family transcriptional regulator